MIVIALLRCCPGAATVLALLLMSSCSYARVVPPRYPRDGVLDASLVVIVSRVQEGVFRIEETLLGQSKSGDTVRLPGLRLYTIQRHGPEKVEPITQTTRVLLFLKARDDDPDAWEVTNHGYCFFWVHRTSETSDLRRIGEKAVSLRISWEKARDIRDERKRVEALWPYLWNHGSSFHLHTEKELQKTGVAAGNHIAERLPEMSRGHRMSLLPELGAYGSERLHTALITHLKKQRELYQAFLAERGPDAKNLIEDWNTAPDEIKRIWAELYYGVTGLASFRDRTDLGFVRELAIWAVEHRFKQTCDAALAAFRDMPDKANLPIIDTIWKEFSSKPYEGNALSPFDVTRTLRSHKFPETIPVLAQLLGDDEAGSEARAFLSEIVGEDLGESVDAWLDWYARRGGA